jgi:hypothetical protein
MVKKSRDWAIRIQAPKPVIARAWRRFRDYMEVGLRDLASLDDSLRYSPALQEIIGIWGICDKGRCTPRSMGTK